MKKLLSLLGACAVCGSMYAQSSDYPWAIGLYGGRTEYNGEYGNHFFDFGRNSSNHLFGAKFYGHGALSVERYLNKNFDAMFLGSYGYYGAEKENSAQEFESAMANANVNIKYKFPFIAKYRVHPFVFAGVGARGIFNIDKPTKESSQVEEGWDLVAQAGLGIEVRLTDHWALRYMGAYGYGFADNHDKMECGSFGDQQLLHSIGIVCSFPFKPKDSDKDGVPDKFDSCSNTPAGVQVDDKGCPLDEDGDKVPDYLDKCPGTPAAAAGKIDSTGCPLDEDGDGVPDYIDECPGTPAEARGMVDSKGCPLDSDGDGVADYLDKCPGTPAEAKGKIDANGCPIDSDGDGIYDYEDACPSVAGIKENKGCPEVKEEVKQVFKKALNGIQFESGKATIKSSSFGILNQIVSIMSENPAYKLNIAGHTDNSGKPEKNLQLSKDRAAAVKQYLVNKGIDGSRMETEGYGDTQPVASNKTKAGKALNRRVAFEVEF